MAFAIDVDENTWSKEVLNVLLIDRTTKRNIIWATSDYEELGIKYNSHYPILPYLITNENSGIIQPRVLKIKEKQKNRTKEKAEVFTPSWVCNLQNNLVDNSWFDRDDVFNKSEGKHWITNYEKIVFPKNHKKSWKKYVDENRLEITCGEAPYLASRYDTVSGKIIEIKDRIGLLDRKLRIVNENTDNEKDWLKWTKRAFESIYGFEFQGDSLLLARENLLATYQEYIRYSLDRDASEKELLDIAKIISWNIWQMDGLTQTIPFQKKVETNVQMRLFEDENENKNKEDVMCVIKDWRARKEIVFHSLIKENRREI